MILSMPIALQGLCWLPTWLHLRALPRCGSDQSLAEQQRGVSLEGGSGV